MSHINIFPEREGISWAWGGAIGISKCSVGMQSPRASRQLLARLRLAVEGVAPHGESLRHHEKIVGKIERGFHMADYMALRLVVDMRIKIEHLWKTRGNGA